MSRKDVTNIHWLARVLNGNARENEKFIAWGNNDNLPFSGFFRPPDRQREVELVVKTAKLLILEDGISAEDILIVLAEPDAYIPLLVSECSRFGIPIDANSRSDSVGDIVSLLARVLALFRTDFRRNEVTAFFEHPIMRYRFDAYRWLAEKSVRMHIIGGKDWFDIDDEQFIEVKNLLEKLNVLNKSVEADKLTEILKKLGKAIYIDEPIAEVAPHLFAEISKQWQNIIDKAKELADAYGNGIEMLCENLIMALVHVYKKQNNIVRGRGGIKVMRLEESRGNSAEFAFFIGFCEKYFPHRQSLIHI